MFWYYLIMEIYKEWLRSNGFRFEETPICLMFKYQGGNFIVANNNGDKNYFQLLFPCIDNVNDTQKVKALEALNTINRELKCIKGTLTEDNEVWLTTEIFVDHTPNVEDFFLRLLDILMAGRVKYSNLMA